MALPTACLVLALVGIPLGLSAKKGGKSTGFVLTIALVFLYYFLFLSGVSLAKQGRFPPALAVWMANIVFFVCGVALLWRMDRMPFEIASLRSVWNRFREPFRKSKQAFAASRQTSAFDRAVARTRVFHTQFPTLLDDLIVRDFFTYVVMILATFLLLLLVFTFFELLSDILHNQVSPLVVIEYLLNLMPYLVYQLTPLSVLLGVLVTFGLMQKANEVTAMKASGISIYRVVFPVLVIAGVLATGLFFFDQVYLPQANQRQDELRNRIKGKAAQTYLRPDRKWIFGEHSTIYYYRFFDPDRDQFGSISAFQFDPHSFEFTHRIYAARSHWQEDLHKWVYEHGWERSFRGPAMESYRNFDAETFAQSDEPPQYFKKEVKQSSEMNYDELSDYIRDLQQGGYDVVRLRVQLQKKLAFPVITFVMAILAVPFALSAGRKGALTGVAISIGVAVLYWTVSSLFEAMGNLSQLPPALAAWSPDLIFALAGGYLILKVPT
jgi:LPS export ABC transporter permease LptG